MNMSRQNPSSATFRPMPPTSPNDPASGSDLSDAPSPWQQKTIGDLLGALGHRGRVALLVITLVAVIGGVTLAVVAGGGDSGGSPGGSETSRQPLQIGGTDEFGAAVACEDYVKARL